MKRNIKLEHDLGRYIQQIVQEEDWPTLLELQQGIFIMAGEFIEQAPQEEEQRLAVEFARAIQQYAASQPPGFIVGAKALLSGEEKPDTFVQKVKEGRFRDW